MALIEAKYPSFNKPDNMKPGASKGEVSIYLSSNCGGMYSLNIDLYPHDQFTRYKEIVYNNALSKGLDGMDRYADIELVAGNLFVQKFINQRKDGSDYFFYKNEQGDIISLISCSEDYVCAALDPKPIYDGRYTYEFRSNGIDPQNFPKIETEISDFLYSLENYNLAPKEKYLYN